MPTAVGVRVWLPAVVTAALLFGVSFGVAAVATDTTADLAGLGYLLVAPFLYRWLRSVTGSSAGVGADTTDVAAES